MDNLNRMQDCARDASSALTGISLTTCEGMLPHEAAYVWQQVQTICKAHKRLDDYLDSLKVRVLDRVDEVAQTKFNRSY